MSHRFLVGYFSTHMSHEVIRIAIALGVAAGCIQSEIAHELGRSPSTICRELARNSPARVSRSKAWRAYRAGLAQSESDKRARRPKPSKIMSEPRLLAKVKAGLGKHWSPRADQLPDAGGPPP